MKMENKKIKLWQIILLIILLLLVIVIIITVRKTKILSDLQKKVSEYTTNSNLYFKVDSEQSTIEKYMHNSLSKLIIKYKDKPMSIVQIIKENEKTSYIFYESAKKVTISNGNDGNLIASSNILQNTIIGDFVTTKSFVEKILKSMSSKIYTENIDGNDYYVIESKNDNNYLNLQNVVLTKVYIDEETGLAKQLVEVTKENNSEVEHVVNFEYNKDTINDDVFENIDTTGYEVNWE